MAARKSSHRERRFCFALASLALVAALIGIAGAPAASYGAITTLIDNGPSSNRVDIVFLGDGYTQPNIDAGVYNAHIQSYVDYMFTSPTYLNDPFDRYASFFNVHKVDVVSAQSGADKPSQGVFVDTALDATYESSGVDRLLTVSNSKANTARNQALAGTGVTADMQYVVVNDTKYGGAGGSWAVFAGGNGSAREIALHEVGHSFSRLADEYSDFTTPYVGEEPTEVNATKSPTGAKWSRWAGFDDPRGSDLDIGAFVGAKRYPTGLYRPSSNSKMRSLGQPFDAVSREKIVLDIYSRVNPLDGWLANSTPVIDQPLWVDLIDATVQGVQWFVDGTLAPEATEATFDASLYGFGPGEYTVQARVFDRVLDHMGDGGLLDLVRMNLSELEQSITWTLNLSPSLEADFDGSGTVDALDLDPWRAHYGLSESAHFGDGDADGDLDVDGSDFLIWQRNVTPGAQAGAVTVPEPTSWPVFLFAAAGVAAWKRRRGILRALYSG
jgi:hypothetical protein